ncbi:uncharacterized protein MONBRDRAFT_13974 [Monosiga brevicollis MX1]|uniref:Pantoate--beta-alanine ligase n=1 Tax=Monosiga brevicollis TaxID=81824 RepID=A9UP50_MONBE|nr:uncharacterized protein MONBRDRAFT_13974 [Monosiga brevicollis MX1]EDQ92811.1 predicted protein [Monosiga brevicollis MX1]|eukprot:XP_001742573.1 hypothetical protein [Monosiga brevicollis MX1]
MEAPANAAAVACVHGLHPCVANNKNIAANASSRPIILTTKAEVHARTAAARVGFVPTMGALHEGHLDLVRAARRDRDQGRIDAIGVSIFVNPAQFAANEDLDRYPQSLDADVELLAAEGVDFVFAPSAREMYPHGLPLNTKLHISDATTKPEGASRPHFFDGVALVCNKLFNIVQPTIVYFGEKDAQQCATIQGMVEDLDIGYRGQFLEVCTVPTRREADGLAMSSRNRNLTTKARQQAVVIPQALTAGLTRLTAAHRGELPPITVAELEATILQSLAHEPALTVHYVAVTDARLRPFPPTAILDTNVAYSDPIIISCAGTIGNVRLIDNMRFTGGHPGA